MALASRMVPIADGSDMGGSLRNPASFCNVVGFRPSTGRVPTWPTDNAWFSFGVQGPMARSVRDVSLILAAIAVVNYVFPFILVPVAFNPAQLLVLPSDAPLPPANGETRK